MKYSLQKSLRKARHKRKKGTAGQDEVEEISLFPVMVRTFWWRYFVGSGLKVAADVLNLATPQVIARLPPSRSFFPRCAELKLSVLQVMSLMIDYATTYAYSQSNDSIPAEPEWHGYFYAATMLVCIQGYSILNATAQAQVNKNATIHVLVPVLKVLVFTVFRCTSWA